VLAGALRYAGRAADVDVAVTKKLPRLLGAMAAVAIANFVVKAIGASKDLVVAHHFGTSDALDAFFVALLIQILIVNTVSASIGDAFLPVFVHQRSTGGRDAAVRSIRNVITIGGLTLLVIALASAAFVRPLVHAFAPQFSPEKQALTCELLRYLLPSVVVAGLAAPFTAVLNANGKYKFAASVPGITPALTLCLLVGFGTDHGVFPLVIGILIGSVLEASVMAWALNALDFPVRPGWVGYDEASRRTVFQAVPLVFASFLATSSVVIDQSMVSYLGSGAVSAFNYGTKVVALVLGIGGLAIGNVIFPEFARLVTERDWAEIKRVMATYMKWTFLAGLVVGGFAILISTPVVRLLFERGAFSPSDTEVVSGIQRCFLIQLPFHLSGLVTSRLLSALGRNQMLIVIGVLTSVVNVLGNYLLMYRLGPAGVALSTSCVFVVAFGVLFVATRRELARRMTNGS
jgi:putative peptidoglycan lipid II flippase